MNSNSQLLTRLLILSVSLRMWRLQIRSACVLLSSCECWWVITSANIDLVLLPWGSRLCRYSCNTDPLYSCECRCLFVTL